MLFTLDDRESLDPRRAGAKATWLARARQAGFPVLPGVVVSAEASKPFLEMGMRALVEAGSGRARLTLSGGSLPEDLRNELAKAVASLQAPLVVRSSSVLEGEGEWSGAFTSYLDVHPGEVEKAILGCWASAFTVAALRRFEAVGTTPENQPMAVLIQPALHPTAGGVARMEGDAVTVTAVSGSPSSLLQGWQPGVLGRVTADGTVRGEDARALLGDDVLRRLALLLVETNRVTGATGCEWALEGDVKLLQLTHTRSARSAEGGPTPVDVAHPDLQRVARLVRRAPGPLGEALILPWALGTPELDTEHVAEEDPLIALAEAESLALSLTAEVWNSPNAQELARSVLRLLRGQRPLQALPLLAALRPPDPDRAAHLVGLVGAVRVGLARRGVVASPYFGWFVEPASVRRLLTEERPGRRDRVGFDRWEPFQAGAVMAAGVRTDGIPAAPGVGAGRMVWIGDPDDLPRFRPRDVIVAPHPLPNLAPLLWDAAGLVTVGGSPAAHLFESARSLGVPSVSNVHLAELVGPDPREASERYSLAVDGDAGAVYATEW